MQIKEIHQIKMNINFLVKKNKINLDGYGDNKFIISGKIYKNPILVLPNEIKIKKNLKLSNIKKKYLEKIIKRYKLEFIILGFDSKIKKILQYKKSCIEVMDTGSACRTINILLSEGRLVGALIFPKQN